MLITKKTLKANYVLRTLLCVRRTIKYVGKILLRKIQAIADKTAKNISWEYFCCTPYMQLCDFQNISKRF